VNEACGSDDESNMEGEQGEETISVKLISRWKVGSAKIGEKVEFLNEYYFLKKVFSLSA
jgi:hypothetical protein